MMGSSISGGVSLVGEVTICFISGDRLRTDSGLSLLALIHNVLHNVLHIKKLTPFPYLALRIWKARQIQSKRIVFVLLLGPG